MNAAVMAQHRTRAHRRRDDTSAPAVSRRALLVEADPGTRTLCRKVLESLGFVVSAMDSGVAAVTEARREPPDLILIDLQLRDIDGFKLMEWLRANEALKTTPIVALSTSAEDSGSLNGWRVSALMKKPVTAGTVEQTIRKIFR